MNIRKRRSDRSHIIYQLTNIVTQEIYIGVTVAVGKAYHKSVKDRLRRHIVRATNETKTWNLCESIRTYGGESFTWDIVDRIRGKASAHSRETELIHSLRPALNSTVNYCQ